MAKNFQLNFKCLSTEFRKSQRSYLYTVQYYNLICDFSNDVVLYHFILAINSSNISIIHFSIQKKIRDPSVPDETGLRSRLYLSA